MYVIIGINTEVKIMLKRKCKITYIAHGATIYSDDYRLCSQENYPPLEEKGQEEIKNICEYIKRRGVRSDKIYSSPATRCIQSAQMISKVFKQDFEVIEELNSRNWGDWNGLTFDSIVEKYNLHYEDGIPSIIATTPENGESIVDFNKRVDATVHKIVDKNLGNRVIVVTGANVIQSVVATTLGVPPERQSRILIKTGSATQISYFDDWSSLIYSGYVPL